MYDRQQTNPAEETGHGRGDEVFGRYELMELLGRGAMGEVWRAKDAPHNREVALKFLYGSGLLSDRERERLRKEALTVIKLHHTNIVRVYDYMSETGGKSAIVMEYVEGETLTQLLEMRPGGVMEVSEAESIVLGIAEALAGAHDHRPGVLHRDVKPDNIMVTKSGRVILMDFGLAETARETLLSRSVKAGVGLRSSGTPLYMSPQQQRGDEAGESDDWYGLGATIYEMLTGRPPFFRGNIEYQIEKVDAPKMVDRRKELGVTGKDIPKEWERAIAEMLSKKPEGRKSAGRELLRRLQRKKVMEVPGGESGARKNGRLGIVMGVVVMLAVTGLVGWQWFGERGEEPATKAIAIPGVAGELEKQEDVEKEKEAARQAQFAREWSGIVAEYRTQLSERSQINLSGGETGLTGLKSRLEALWDELTREVEARRVAGVSEAVWSGEYPGKLGEELLGLWEEKKGAEWSERVREFREMVGGGVERVEDWKLAAERKWEEVSHGPYGDDLELYAKLGLDRSAQGQAMPAPPLAELEAEWEAAQALWLAQEMEGGEAGEVKTIGGMEMVWCPPGTFMMGSPGGEEGRDDDERQREVRLTTGFWLAKTECTQGQWEKVMGTDVAAQQAKENSSGDVTGVGREHPMYFVSWGDAQEWIVEMNKKHPPGEGWKWSLPTEAQWEYACRAWSEGAYGGTGNLNETGWYGENSGRTTHGVGGKKPNAWGLYDMHGNVWEWCLDWYGEYPSGAVNDPEGSYRVNRGGSWFSDDHDCRSAHRAWDYPEYRSDFLGFRPAVSSSR